MAAWLRSHDKDRRLTLLETLIRVGLFVPIVIWLATHSTGRGSSREVIHQGACWCCDPSFLPTNDTEDMFQWWTSPEGEGAKLLGGIMVKNL